MKLTNLAYLVFFGASLARGHLIFSTLIAGDVESSSAVRLPTDPSPLLDITSEFMTCNNNTLPANDTAIVAAGSTIGFHLGEYQPQFTHQGPAAIYLARVPRGKKIDEWDGTGKVWFKIAEWGVDTFQPVNFKVFLERKLETTIPKNTPSGYYLVRAEQIGIHITGWPQAYMSCAQIRVIKGGRGNPRPLVSIPGHIPVDHPGITANIWDAGFTSYEVPGPKVWRG